MAGTMYWTAFTLHVLQISIGEFFRKVQNIESIHHERHAFVYIDISWTLMSTVDVQSAETRIRQACKVCCSHCALIMLDLSVYARQGLPNFARCTQANVKPQPHQYFFLVKSRKTATLIQISDGKTFFFKTRSPNFAVLKLFLRRLSPQACL